MPAPIPFPPSLPNPVTCTLEPNVRGAVSSMEGGAKASRARTLDRVAKHSVTWEFDADQYDTFKAWHELHRDRRVSIPLPGVGGVVPRSGKFLDEPTVDAAQGVNRWRVSVDVEVA